MRSTWLVIGLCLLAMPLYGGEISGSINFDGSTWQSMKVGYVGKDAAGSVIDCCVDAEYTTNALRANSSTYGRETTMEWELGAINHSYKHTNLPKGRYLVYLQVDEFYFDWKIVELKSSSSKICLDLSITSNNTGTVKLQFPKAQNYRIILVPVTPLSKTGNSVFFGKGYANEATTTINKLKAGTYRVELSTGHKSGGVWTYKPLGTSKIVVKPGKNLLYRVPR